MGILLHLSAIVTLLCWNVACCFAQQTTGPATLENIVNADAAQEASAVTGRAEGDAGPKRQAGTVTRPKDGVQHPDLDKAWAAYDAVVVKVAESIRNAINDQFDAAAAKGNLDVAEKWQMAFEKFEKNGELPNGTETKTAVATAISDYKKAKHGLSKAYETVVRSLTKEKKIAEAKLVRDELRAVSKFAGLITKIPPQQVVERTVNERNGRPKPTRLVAKNQAYSHYRLVAKKSNANGWEAYYRTIEFFDAATGKPLTGGKATGTGTGAADAFDNDRETSYRTVMNPGLEEDWIAYELPKAVLVDRVRVVQLGAGVNHVFWFEVQGSNDGVNWTPLMNAQGVPFDFDSDSAGGARVTWNAR